MLPTLILMLTSYIAGREAYLNNPSLNLFRSILESLRCIRVFRLLRLVKQVRPLRILAMSLQASKKELLILIALISFTSTVWGTIIFYVEILSNTFYGIGYGIWWAVVTMTTVGYGDYVPKTGWGYMIGTLCALSGVLIIALPIPVIANNFNAYYRWYTFAERINKRRMGMKNAKCSEEKRKKLPEVITNDLTHNKNNNYD